MKAKQFRPGVFFEGRFFLPTDLISDIFRFSIFLESFLVSFIFGYMYTFLLGMYIGGESLGHGVGRCLALADTIKQFSKMVVLI